MTLSSSAGQSASIVQADNLPSRADLVSGVANGNGDRPIPRGQAFGLGLSPSSSLFGLVSREGRPLSDDVERVE